MSVDQGPLFFRQGAWRLSGLAIAEVATKFSTPLFVYDQRTLESQFHSLREALPDIVDLYYSIKANPNPAIVRQFGA